MTDLRPSVDRLLTFIEAREVWLTDAELVSSPGREFEFNVLLGVCAQAIRYAGAFAALTRLKRGREAVALARQAVEHAVTAQWAHFTDGGIERLFNSYQSTNHRFYLLMAEWMESEQLASEVNAALVGDQPNGKNLPPVSEMLRASHAFLVTIYMQESQLVHVTGTSVTGSVEDRDGQFVVRRHAVDPYASNTAYLAGIATMFSTWLLAELTADAELLAKLNEESDALRLPLNIRA